MSRRKQPLPEYSALIRWTVQEVINWLGENSLSDCSKCFREGGVDGNKLVNITDTDLMNIKCPRKYIKEIVNHVSTVRRPGVPARTGGYGNRANNQRQVPFNDINHVQDDGSDDDGCWDEDEFSSGYSDDENASDDSFKGPARSEPKAPPRPNRRDPPALPRVAAPPPAASHRRPPAPEPEQVEEVYEEPDDTCVPEVRGRPQLSDEKHRPPLPVPGSDSSDENYEDPDANMKVQHFHGGPLPKLPTEKQKHVLIGQRKPPPLPVPSSQIEEDETSSGPEEEYEDPDKTVAAKGPPLPNGPRRPQPPLLSSIPKLHHDIPAEPSEDYEEPDLTIAKKMAQKSAQRKPPPPPSSSVPTTRSVRKQPVVQEEEYEDPDQTVSKSQKPLPPPVSRIPQRHPSTHSAKELPAYEMPEEENTRPPVPRNVPKKKHSEPKIVQEETYEVPDETDSAPSRPAPQRYQKTVPQHEEETYEVPDPDENEEQDDYLDMELEKVGPLSSQTTAPGSRHKPEKVPRGKMPLPNALKSSPGKDIPERKVSLEPQETYEVPEAEAVKAPPKKKMGVSVLPVMKDMKISNGLKESSPTQHSKLGRALPPPPAVSSERAESVKNEPEKRELTKTVSSAAPKEMTEADLLRQKWYHGNIKRVDAELKLKQLSIDGMYLIRKSSQGSDQPYTLQIFYKTKVYNLPIRRRADSLFAVGKEEKDNEKAFASLLDLVNGFKQNILVLSGGAETKLVKSLPKT